MKKRKLKSVRGIALVAVVVVGAIFAILGFSLLKLAEFENSAIHNDIGKAKAFYFAEAGIARFITNAYEGNFENVDDTSLEEGNYRVDVFRSEYPGYAISTGISGTEKKRIRVQLAFLAYPYEHAIFGGNSFEQDWTLDLRGRGDPQSPGGRGREVGGRDIINGKILVDGDIALYEESSVNSAILPNTYGLGGDVEATGSITVDEAAGASVSGATRENVPASPLPDLRAMNYAVNNSHDVGQLFADEGIGSGRLPLGNELYDAVVKNPSGMSQEAASTVGDDYFFEPARISGSGSYKTATTPLRLSDGAIYYVDGNVWIHNATTYGFLVDGKVTIVATGDIHISDNIAYANKESALGLVALGKYDSAGQLAGGGNIYLGDPRFGTTYTVDALMFAANDFLYSTDSITGNPGEPETGFSVYGSFAGMNHVSVNRDWYDSEETGKARPAFFDPSTNQWMDVGDGTVLTTTEIADLRHYRMEVTYDERIRDIATQPPGLPRGPGTIFNGITRWEDWTHETD